MSRFFPDDYGWPYHLRTKDREGDDYTVKFAMEDEKRRIEWEEEFQGAFPYVSDGKRIHEEITSRKRD